MEQKELKEKIRSILSNKESLIFIGIIVLALIIRIWYFIATKSQPLWWDEAEYMLKAKSLILHTPTTGFAPIREAIAPYFWAFLYFISPGESLIRFFQVIISTLTVVFTYFVASKLYSNKIALFASLLMAVFSIHLFFTERILTYLWAPLLYLLVIFFFIKRDQHPKYLYISSAILAFSIVTYFSASFLAFVLLALLLFEERLNFFKNKIYWKALLVFILVLAPFVIYYMITAGIPLPRFIEAKEFINTSSPALPFSQWFGYLKILPIMLRLPLLIAFILSALYSLFYLFIGLGFIMKNEKLKKDLFIWLWIIVPVLSYSLIEITSGTAIFYDAFILPIFPAIFIVISSAFFDVYSLIAKSSKAVAVLLLILAIIFATYPQLHYADTIIKGKVNSYNGIKEMGLYLKQVSSPNDFVVSSAVPAITYYSELSTYKFPQDSSSFNEFIKEKKPKFMVLTAFEASPPWVNEWLVNNTQVVPIQAHFQDAARTKPDTIVYIFNYSD
jgi:hypothetical protein